VAVKEMVVAAAARWFGGGDGNGNNDGNNGNYGDRRGC